MTPPLRLYALLATCLAVPASAQYLDYEFRQSGPETVALERVLFWAHPLLPSSNASPTPALLPETMPSTGAAEVRGERSVLPLDRLNRSVSYIGLSRTAPVFAKSFPDVATMRQTFPDGTYTVWYSGFATTYAAAPFTYHHATPATPRILNYDTLQNWDGADFVIQWSPVGTASNFFAQSECRIFDATGRVVLSFPMGSDRLAAGMARLPGINVAPGTTLTCELPFDVAAGPPTPSESVEGAMGRTLPGRLLLRFPIRRAAASVPPTTPPITTPPAIAAQPVDSTVLNGAPVTLSVTGSGSDLTYQWRRDGAPVAGATNATLTLAAAGFGDAGNYTVVITNGAGTVISDAARLIVNAVTRISNVSLLTSLEEPGDSFTLGYVVGGASAGTPKPLVIRAAGPSLGVLGVPGTLEQPKLELFAGSTRTAENARWGGDTRLRDAMAAVGAFPFAGPDSRDAAALVDLTGRDNSVKVSAADRGTGVVIAEIYDATPPPQFTAATPRLLNVSVLKPLGTGVTVGFVIAGTSPTTVLIRAIGPTLGVAPFGVPDVVADPQLTVFNSSQTKVAENNDWGGTTGLFAAFASVGAFGLPADSRDAAVTAALSPGNYTVEVRGVNNTTGTVLIEVYEVR